MFAMFLEGQTFILTYEPQGPLTVLVLGPNVTSLMLDVRELDPGGKVCPIDLFLMKYSKFDLHEHQSP